jgi:hypothetical protein
MSDVQDVTAEHLHIFYLEVGNTVYDNIPSVVLLATSFGIETRPVQKNTESIAFRQVRGG